MTAAIIRDAVMLAKLHRADELTAIWIPDAAQEAMRDLVRARATAGRVLAQARQHLQGFCCAMTGSTAGLKKGTQSSGGVFDASHFEFFGAV